MVKRNFIFQLDMIVLIFILFGIKALCDIGKIEYGIVLITGIMCLYGLWKRCVSETMLSIVLWYMVYMMAQMYGLINNFSLYAIRCIIASVLILLFFIYCSEFMGLVMLPLLCKMYYLFQIVLWIKVLRQGIVTLSQHNVWAGYYLFLFAIYAVMYILSTESKEVLSFKQWCVLLVNGISCILLIYFTDSRAAILTGGIIFLCFVLFMYHTPSLRTMKMGYWIAIIGIAIITIFYINIRTYDWYDTLNNYSQMFFSKNIDSARGYLWSTGLEQVGSHWLLGIGTGVLPNLIRFSTSSYHNMYIQLYIQNGLVGLGSVVIVLYMIWKTLCQYKDDLVIKLVMACMVGIIFYNCFEVALLANKVALGLMQWFIMGIGINYVRRLKGANKN